MKSSATESLPARVRRSLLKLGSDISRARKKRSLTAAMVAERVGIARSTYTRVERGDPTVSMGTYAMTLFVLGLGTPLGELADPRRDEDAMLLDDERLPQRVRLTRKATPL